MRGIAAMTRSHWPSFHQRLIRIPMRKTTNSPSNVAVIRLGMMALMMHSFVVDVNIVNVMDKKRDPLRREPGEQPFDGVGVEPRKRTVVADLVEMAGQAKGNEPVHVGPNDGGNLGVVPFLEDAGLHAFANAVDEKLKCR